MKKEKISRVSRRAWAITMPAVLNMMGSLSAMMLAEPLRLYGDGLTREEQLFIIKRREELHEWIQKMRKFSHRLRRTC